MVFKLKKLGKSEVVVVVLPSSSYKKKELELVKQLSGKFKSICYVNINHQLGSLIKDFQKIKIELKKFMFIDAVTDKSEHEYEQCIYVGSPNALTDLSLAVKRSLETKGFGVLIFDSISSLLIYHKAQTITRFVHDLFAAVKMGNAPAFFTVQAGTNQNLMADISMFADQVIKIGESEPLRSNVI